MVGKGQLPIVDTWWQTETGGIMVSPLPGATPMKPGSATLPFFGVNPKVKRFSFFAKFKCDAALIHTHDCIIRFSVKMARSVPQTKAEIL